MTNDTARIDTRTLWGEHALALRRRGLADGTIRQRHYLVTAYFRFCELRGVGIWDADAEHVEQFLDAIKRKPSARCCATSHVHMFYAWAMTKGYTDRDPTAGVVRPRLVPGLPRPIHDDRSTAGARVRAGRTARRSAYGVGATARRGVRVAVLRAGAVAVGRHRGRARRGCWARDRNSVLCH